MTTATLTPSFSDRASTKLGTWMEMLGKALAMNRAINHDFVTSKDVEKVRAIAAKL